MGTDDAGQSSVLASVHPVLDPSMEPLVRDSVGQTTSLPAVELGNSIEEDERVRPRSVNLLGDSRVIDSKEPEGSEIRTKEGQNRPGGISGRREEIMVQSLRSSSAVRAPVLHMDDSSPGFSVGDSVGHTASSLSTGILGGVVEEDGWFRPKSMDLLGDCRVINPPGLPGTSFRPSEVGVVPKMDSQSGTQMSIRSWNCPSNYIHPRSLTVDDGRCHPKLKCPSNYIHPKGLTVDDGRCHPKLKYKRGKGVS